MSKDKLSRRQLLKASAVSGAGVFFVSGSALAERSEKKEVDRFESSVKGKANLKSTTVKLYSDGSTDIEAEGTVSTDDHNEVYRVKTDYLSDNDGSPTPGRGRVRVESAGLASVRSRRGEHDRGGSKGPYNSTRPTDGEISPLVDGSDQGMEYSRNYQGGMQTTFGHGWKQDVNVGQTYRWDVGNGSVQRYRDRYICWYAGIAASLEDGRTYEHHQWQGDKFWSKATMQYTDDSPSCGGGTRVELNNELKAHPDGQFWWKGVVKAGGCSSGDTSYVVHSDYWNYCADDGWWVG